MRPEIRHHRRQPADVVFVRVRERDRVQPPHGTCPQVRRHDIFADIEPWLAAHAMGCDAAAIEEHQLAVRKRQKQALALPDVDRGSFEHAALRLGRERMPDQNGEAHCRDAETQSGKAIAIS